MSSISRRLYGTPSSRLVAAGITLALTYVVAVFQFETIEIPRYLATDKNFISIHKSNTSDEINTTGRFPRCPIVDYLDTSTTSETADELNNKARDATTGPFGDLAAANASRCQHFNNRIIYLYEHQAGLNDRISSMDSLSNLAAYLCGKVVVPPPYRWLTPKHNHGGKSIDQGLTWNDNFTSFHLAEVPGESAIIESPQFHPNRSDPIYAGPVFAPKSIPQLVQQFDQVYKWMQHQQSDPNMAPFVWNLSHLNYFEFRNDLCDHWLNDPLVDPSLLSTKPKIGCPALFGSKLDYYVKTDHSLHAQKLAQSIMKEHGLVPESFGYLHIRRNDDIRKCDSSLEKVYSYLKCSLKNFTQPPTIPSMTKQNNRYNFTLVMSTDEVDPLYRKGVQDIVVQKLGFQFIDVDQVLKARLKKSDNYQIFQMEKVIIEKASFLLKIHRSHCVDCDLKSVQAYLAKQ